MDATILRRISIDASGRFELHVFRTDRAWIRLRDVIDRRSLGFWSAAGVSDDWRSVATDIAKHFAENDPPAWSLELWPPGWLFWGPAIPAPIHSLVPRLDALLADHPVFSTADLHTL